MTFCTALAGSSGSNPPLCAAAAACRAQRGAMPEPTRKVFPGDIPAQARGAAVPDAGEVIRTACVPRSPRSCRCISERVLAIVVIHTGTGTKHAPDSTLVVAQ